MRSRTLVPSLLVIYWLGLIWGTHVPDVPMPAPHYNDKLLHFLAYAGLAFLLYWTWVTRRGLSLIGAAVSLLIAIGYGVIDEITQGWVPQRVADPKDWAADLLGATSGVLLFWCLACVWRSWRRGAWVLFVQKHSP